MECDKVNIFRTLIYFFHFSYFIIGNIKYSLNYTQFLALPPERLRPGLQGSALKGGELPFASPLIQSMANIMFLAKNIHCGLLDKSYILDDSLEDGRFQ